MVLCASERPLCIGWSASGRRCSRTNFSATVGSSLRMCITSKDGKRRASTPAPVVMPAKEEFVIMMLLNGCFIHQSVSFCHDRGIVLCFPRAVTRAHTHVHLSICH